MFLISCWTSALPLPMILLASQLFSSCFLFHMLLTASAWSPTTSTFNYTATALSLWSTSHCSVSSTEQLGITCFSSLLFLSPSCTASALHQGWRCLQMSAYSTRLWIAFSALHVGSEDMDVARFWCSDITRDRGEQGKSVMIYCKSACRTPPSSSSILASPSLSTQATTHFLSSLHVIFPPLQLGGLLWPFFSFGGFKALSLVPPLSPSHLVSGWFHLQAEFKFLIITRSTSYCSSVSWPVFQTFLSRCLFNPNMAKKKIMYLYPSLLSSTLSKHPNKSLFSCCRSYRWFRSSMGVPKRSHLWYNQLGDSLCIIYFTGCDAITQWESYLVPHHLTSPLVQHPFLQLWLH